VRAAFGWVSAGDGDDRVDCEREVHSVAVSVSAGVFVDSEAEAAVAVRERLRA
jgi:hypothetical protein